MELGRELGACRLRMRQAGPKGMGLQLSSLVKVLSLAAVVWEHRRDFCRRLVWQVIQGPLYSPHSGSG